MADRHYGLDVKVLQLITAAGTFDNLGSFESCDFSADPIVKESQSAQDTGPVRRITAVDFTLTLNNFIEGLANIITSALPNDHPEYFKDVTITIQFTPGGTGNTGTTNKTLTLNNCICTKCSVAVGSDATKESLEFKRGTGNYVWS